MFRAFIRFLKSLLPQRDEVKIPEPHKPQPLPQPDKPEPRQKRIAIIIGHTQEDQGAVSYNGQREWSYNHRVALKVKFGLQGIANVKIFYRDDSKSYKSAMRAIAREVVAWGADLSIELHFNSFEKVAYGCEILVAHDANNFEDTIRLADIWTDKLAARFNLKERNKVKFKDNTYGDGVKVLKTGERGYWNLAYLSDYGVPKSILIEPMFANIKTEESMKFFEANGIGDYSGFLVDMIREF